MAANMVHNAHSQPNFLKDHRSMQENETIQTAAYLIIKKPIK